MKSQTPIDYAVFQLSPKRSRCELFVSSYGKTEKLASGLVKPFVTHLKVAEEQVALAAQSIKLEVEKYRNAEAWFTKETLERFVRFVSTPEILELVNTFDSEMSQLEAARRIYSQGVGDQHSSVSGGDGSGTADATKKELLRAMDVRLVAVRQDLTTACARASAAGFNPDSVSELQLFADRFGADRLNKACRKFISVSQRRPDLINNHLSWKSDLEDQPVRSSTGSDMSIDDHTEDHFSGPNQNQSRNHLTGQPHHLDQSNPSTCQQPNSSATTFPLQRAQDKLTANNNAVEEKEEGVTESAQTIQQQPTRRLSVQDRINLFENKQKENSGGKPAVVLAVKSSSELRRLSSDVSSSSSSVVSAAAASTVVSSEKAVLRRWSGASDMSIDVSSERKDIENSPNCTPSHSSVFHQNKSVLSSGVSIDKGAQRLNDTASSAKADVKSSLLTDQADSQTRVGLLSTGKGEEIRLHALTNRKDQISEKNQFQSFLGKSEQVGLNDQTASEEESGELKEIASVKEESGGLKEKSEFSNRREDDGLRQPSLTRSRPGGSVKPNVDVSLKNRNSFTFQPRSQSFPEKLDSFTDLRIQETAPLQNVEALSDPVEDSKMQKLKFQKQDIAHEHLKKSQIRKDENSSTIGSRLPAFQGKKVSESNESFNLNSMASKQQVQSVKQGKGKQELNDELKLKANELEKLFAEHQLRVPGDVSTSSRRSKPAVTPESTLVPETAGSFSSFQNFNSPSVMKSVDIQDYGSDMKRSLSELSYSHDSRGQFYDKYIQKRDAKLKEEWGTKRPEKEAKMKAMQDSLERSRAELKVRFSASADKQDSLSNTRRRTEKLRSFNFRSNMKKEQPIDYIKSDEDEDVSDLLEQKPYGQDRCFSETSLVDSVSKTTQARKAFPGRNLPSSTLRTSAAPASRSSVKASNSIAGRRRAQTENPLALSVPNFSDFRKENTKPSIGASRTSPRIQVRTHTRNKSSSEEISSSKDEKSRRSQSVKKGSTGFVEFNEALLSSDGIVLTPGKFDELNDHRLDDKVFKNVESKPFLRKGNGIGPGAGASVANKQKASNASETFRNEEEYEALAFEPEDSVDMVKEEDFEGVVEDFTDLGNGKPSGSQESYNSASENGDEIRSHSPVDIVSVTELPTVMPSVIHPLGSLQDSPGESPMSWNSRSHHLFSYPHEISDVDASVDSPMGSPASWNSHSLAQTEAEAARMRKKWGSAQKPIVVANSSQNQSRKDMTKGFKRLLKFGRKSRGSESLADWISATTSEGDDDTEDGRDPANRSSDDLRKSRMGFSQSHPSDDGFNESELYNEQALHSSIPAPPANFKLREDHLSGSSLKAPRSFFSLSSFRSKGSDSRPR